VLASVIRVVLAAGLLLGGGGLLSLPIGSLFGSLLQRHLARRRVRALLAGHQRPEEAPLRNYLAVLWPNTWRLGVQLLSGYLTVNANTAICVHVLGLSANARYGLSVQLVSIIAGMAAVWTFVKWPIIAQYLARHDLVGVQRVLRPRVWLQNSTFLFGCAGVLVFVHFLLHWVGSGKQTIPIPWLVLLMLNALFETQFNIWGTLLATQNRLPYLWPTVATNVLSLALSLILVHFTSLGLGALVLGPLIAGCLFNYWYWPLFTARSLGTTLFRLLFVGVEKPAASI